MHTALIMDGNGRWAGAVRRFDEQAPGLAITTLTMYTFSSNYWTRPRAALLRSIDEIEVTTQDRVRVHLRLAEDY